MSNISDLVIFKEKKDIFDESIVAVIGGTGTIGSLIIENLMNTNVKIIRVVSNDENSLWEKQQEWGNGKFRYIMKDIRDKDSMKTVLNGVDYVFNCAAIKHVPFAEYNPLEAVKTNIIGLENIINGCHYNKVKKLLHISTDKAVEPTCIMGCSKRISERLLQVRWAQNPYNTNMVCVRLGNVYGSRGSIINIARKLKETKKPIMLTNPDMERFFMYPDELVDFIMKAFEEGKNGHIWVPKLKQQKIIEVISQIVGKQHPVEIIGERIGEKVKEQLFSRSEKKNMYDKGDYWIIKNDLDDLSCKV